MNRSTLFSLRHLQCVLVVTAFLIAGHLQSQTHSKKASEKPYRVVVSSDFPPLDVIPGGAGCGPAEKRSDPDDIQSMVRFLLYTNLFDVEGLIASSGTFGNIANKSNILDLLSDMMKWMKT